MKLSNELAFECWPVNDEKKARTFLRCLSQNGSGVIELALEIEFE